VAEPQVELLDRLLLASTMANLACGNAGLGLVHGLNKGITYLFHTGRYPVLSYGDLHSVLLPWVNRFNAPAAPERYARLMGVEGGLDDLAVAEEGTRRLEAWLAAPVTRRTRRCRRRPGRARRRPCRTTAGG